MAVPRSSSTTFNFITDSVTFLPINIENACHYLSYQISSTVVTTAKGGGLDVTTSDFLSINHGFFTGLKGKFTTTGTLPTGLSAGVNYYISVVNSDYFKVSTTLNNALASPPVYVVPTTAGTGILTFTPNDLTSGLLKLQFSNDYKQTVDINGNIISTGTFFNALNTETHTQVEATVTTTQNLSISAFNMAYKWARLAVVMTGASVKFNVTTKTI